MEIALDQWLILIIYLKLKRLYICLWTFHIYQFQEKSYSERRYYLLLLNWLIKKGWGKLPLLIIINALSYRHVSFFRLFLKLFFRVIVLS